MKSGINQVDIEVLTLKDFLKVFNYDNFGERACEVIRQEFRANLFSQISKQKTVEMSYRDQIVNPQVPSYMKPQSRGSQKKLSRNGSVNSQELGNVLRSIGSTDSLKSRAKAPMFTANTDLDDAMSMREAVNSDIISRDSENEESMNIHLKITSGAMSPQGQEMSSKRSIAQINVMNLDDSFTTAH